MSVTAKDIAIELGISQPTVSRALSGKKECRVATETRRRVLKAAKEMGYQPNELARSLRSQRTNTIGFYCSAQLLQSGRWLPGDFWIALKRACDAYGLDMLMHTNRQIETTGDVLQNLVGGRTDGAIVYLVDDSLLSRRLEATSFPIVSIGSMLVEACADAVDKDDALVDVVKAAVDKLV